MGTSQKTFEQVKNILGKLDQRIDSLRTGRSATPAGAVANASETASAAPGLHSTIGAPSTPSTQAVPPAPVNGQHGRHDEPLPLNPPSRSAYGRATPIRFAS